MLIPMLRTKSPRPADDTELVAMIETLRQIITPKPQAQLAEGGSEDTIESVALAGAARVGGPERVE